MPNSSWSSGLHAAGASSSSGAFGNGRVMPLGMPVVPEE